MFGRSEKYQTHQEMFLETSWKVTTSKIKMTLTLD